jgi:uncharacterized protein YggU (UPF0235/DUF167 family)
VRRCGGIMSTNLKDKLLKILIESKKGAIISLYVKPYSNREELAFEGDELVFYTTEIPEKGRVNAALTRFLARRIGLPISRIEIIYGVRDRSKKILVRDIDIETLAEKLVKAISQQS